MNFDGLIDKAKELAADNREAIEAQADKFIDSKIQGENAERAKMGVDKALDSLLGRGDNPETTEPAGTPAEDAAGEPAEAPAEEPAEEAPSEG